MSFLDVLTQVAPETKEARTVNLSGEIPLLTPLPKGFKRPRKWKRVVGIPLLTIEQVKAIRAIKGKNAREIKEELNLPVGYAAVWGVMTYRTYKDV